MIGFADYSFALIYYSSLNKCTFVVSFDPSNNVKGYYCAFTATAAVSTTILCIFYRILFRINQVPLNAFAIPNSDRTLAYVVSETDTTDISVGKVTDAGSIDFSPMGPVDPVEHATNLAIALSGDRTISLLYNVGPNLTCEY